MVEPPLFDIPGVRPSKSALGGEPEISESNGAGGSGSADATYIEDPLRRPDSGSGPGVPTQPPLF